MGLVASGILSMRAAIHISVVYDVLPMTYSAIRALPCC